MNQEALNQTQATYGEDLKGSYGPGKFEGEPPEVLYFHCCSGDGEGMPINSNGADSLVFKIETDEQLLFGLTGQYFEIWENDQGFVGGRQLSLEDHAILTA